MTKFGNSNSYQLAPRAEIFRRDVGTVVDMESFEYIMRYNDYLNDPYAMGNPWSAVCARGDLTSANYTTYTSHMSILSAHYLFLQADSERMS